MDDRAPPPETARNIDRLLAVMARLRDPERGCPWDVAQDFSTIAPYTIEEAYEVADAIERGDLPGLRDELGDLLLQVVFHARMAEEARAFDFDAVAGAIVDKMVRRHPHVFADAAFADLGEQKAARLNADWEARKAAERAERGETGALAGVARGLPALLRAVKLQKRAARVGFDWPEEAPVLAKIDEELAELRHEIAEQAGHERLQDELGDLLFAVVNLARHLKVDPEAALRHTNAKFERRFGKVEQSLAAEGKSLVDSSLDDMEEAWQKAKRDERRPDRRETAARQTEEKEPIR
ncbi:ATP diphosphatase [Tistlia consotensis]|uniref:Nucleoside triphosphate pyrophosphohydrolase n=1 Tax=Tistlia consotensis USBA 355 TaxID=560819 RepID=A0A1Y6CJ76_9PROT|nr:nucleoside triphosphate pyrophosphohydrolase [Tistlia consotensis]SMF68632.1 ATP diphosphatase [Tistlia consotensis USBA 355]SNS01135.1 ATP diphosphatase [Tistlia consotensis]